MADVFISYNREDRHRARAIADALEAEGLSVWWDTNLRAGDSYDEVTERNLREAGAVVVLWSKRSVNSKWVRAEATVGERNSILVPAMIEDCDRPLRFELVQAADLVRWHGDRGDPNWRTFVHDIKTAIGHHEQAMQSGAAPAAAGGPSASGHANGDVTIENTFWTSIKDGHDRSDFKAYLARYPNGHFADLARNRLKALERAETEAEAKRAAAARAARDRAAASRPAPPAQRPPQQPAQQQRTAAKAPQRAAGPTSPAPQRSEARKGGGVGLIAIVGVVVLVIGGGGFLFLRNGAPPKTEIAGAPAPAAEAKSVSKPEQADIDAAADAPQVTDEPRRAGLEDPALEEAADDGAPAADEPQPVETAASEEGLESELDDAVEEAAEASGDQTPGAAFTDCDVCPLMAPLPGGVFVMGSSPDEPGHVAYEGPQREVTVEPFAIGVHEVTFDQWAACIEDGGCRGYEPGDRGFGRGARPAMYISWNDAKAYAAWLTRKTGRKYRLPTEAEWEYAARAGSETAYWWGPRFDAALAPTGQTHEVGALSANRFGLYDMLGNVAEWVEDCYINNYRDAPTDGSAVLTGDCGRRVMRGGDWRSRPTDMRVANRKRIPVDTRDSRQGFRVVAEIE